MGGSRIPQGMSAAAREALLLKEETMAMEREDRQRKIFEEQERSRLAREEAQRTFEELSEAERIAEIERLEEEGAEVSQDTEDILDTDTGVTNLFSALAAGTGFTGTVESSTEIPSTQNRYKRPK